MGEFNREGPLIESGNHHSATRVYEAFLNCFPDGFVELILKLVAIGNPDLNVVIS
ncbi:hypothetical protein [Paenarthrobacter ureafaciens]|uniref:hypothetical protein n=1 Tax=Paenarthrobacter ureafaciens TaxID=37931 RepID=UPI002DBD4B28|nr:hypothetical protein [Paenarthrobacter ureafaciens]MEC3853979.1 hypothetical protein [Paenarthrobacter ureafaciens]